LQRKLLYLGLSLFLIGIICLIVADVKFKEVKFTTVITSPPGSWEVTGNLTSKKTYVLDIESGDEWGELFKNGTLTSPQPVNVTITSPEGGVTKLQAFFYGLSTSSPYYQEGTPPIIVEVAYQTIDDSSLQVDGSTSQIRFTVKRDGAYIVQVLKEGLSSREPPNEMRFYEEVFLSKNVYDLLVLSGGLLCIVGGVISVWSIFRKESVRRKRMHKSKQ